MNTQLQTNDPTYDVYTSLEEAIKLAEEEGDTDVYHSEQFEHIINDMETAIEASHPDYSEEQLENQQEITCTLLSVLLNSAPDELRAVAPVFDQLINNRQAASFNPGE